MMLTKDQIRYTVSGDEMCPAYVVAAPDTHAAGPESSSPGVEGDVSVGGDVSAEWLQRVLEALHMFRGRSFSDWYLHLKELPEFLERDALCFLGGMCEVLRQHLFQVPAVQTSEQRLEILRGANRLRQQAASVKDYVQKLEQHFQRSHGDISIELYGNLPLFQPLHFLQIPTLGKLAHWYNHSLLCSLLMRAERLEVSFRSGATAQWWVYGARLWGQWVQVTAGEVWTVVIDGRISAPRRPFEKELRQRWQGMIRFLSYVSGDDYEGQALVSAPPQGHQKGRQRNESRGRQKRRVLRFSACDFSWHVRDRDDVKAHAQREQGSVTSICESLLEAYPADLRAFIECDSPLQFAFYGPAMAGVQAHGQEVGYGYVQREVPGQGLLQVRVSSSLSSFRGQSQKGPQDTGALHVIFPWQQKELLQMLRDFKAGGERVDGVLYLVPKVLQQEPRLERLIKGDSPKTLPLVFYHKRLCSRRSMRMIEEWFLSQ